MTADAPVHPDASLPNGSEGAAHELLDDVLDEEGSSKTQRLLGWVSVVLVAVAAVAAWRLL